MKAEGVYLLLSLDLCKFICFLLLDLTGIGFLWQIDFDRHSLLFVNLIKKSGRRHNSSDSRIFLCLR